MMLSSEVFRGSFAKVLSMQRVRVFILAFSLCLARDEPFSFTLAARSSESACPINQRNIVPSPPRPPPPCNARQPSRSYNVHTLRAAPCVSRTENGVRTRYLRGSVGSIEYGDTRASCHDPTSPRFPMHRLWLI